LSRWEREEVENLKGVADPWSAQVPRHNEMKSRANLQIEALRDFDSPREFSKIGIASKWGR
jgi:hypothetical protein